MADGKLVVFHGYFDNFADIAVELGSDAKDHATVYGLAVEKWGDEADRKIIGEYCAVVADPERKRLRLSRSPLRAPPLCYFHDDGLVVTASVPRAIFAAGVERRLNLDRVADSALLNFSNPEASWFDHIHRVPNGTIVELQPGRDRELRQFHSLLDLPEIQMESDADYIARAGELLDAGVKACLAGFRRPGATLSGGLDSPQIAVRTLQALPNDAHLPTFTFHTEQGFDGIVEEWMFGDERPLVEKFAAMHPRLEPHFTANEGYEHDHRWNELFHLMGGAPSGLCNMYVFHGLFDGAARKGCDVLLVSDWGNVTFSEAGNWGFVEYLMGGQLGQLRGALAGLVGDNRSMAWRFIARCIMPLLPEPIWRLVRRIVFPGRGALLEKIQPLSRNYREASGGQRRLADAGLLLERAEARSRKHAIRQHVERGDFEVDEVYQAFEQLYGIAQRDPTAYRPFVEFCLGLPTRMFLRDGQSRWLARQMAKGVMPEEQRLNPRTGRWDADWHLRIGRRRKEYLAELDRMEEGERLASMIDVPRLRAALEDWPEQTVTDRFQALPIEMAVPRGLLTARFVNWVEGRNQP
jgi:asparagine synthase (glutamine-hydrolysing)